MKICDIIETIKKNCQGYGKIDEVKTRDQVLWGSTDKECTGIVCTIYASIDVIKKAHELGANFIISHEACFWNHGDHTDWLVNNKTFLQKKALLEEYGITVWRDHDYIHSNVLYNGEYVDGIFYGLATELGWNEYVEGDKQRARFFVIPPTPTREVAKHIMDRLGLNGMKTMGDLDGMSSRIMIPSHIIGVFDNQMLTEIEENNVDTILAMEITDFTVAIYARDSAQLGRGTCVLNAGHFNIEEPGMKWFAEAMMPTLVPEVKTNFVKAGDPYTMLLNK